MVPAERKQGGKVAGAVFLTALLDFVGLAALLPVLYYLLDGGENRQAATTGISVSASYGQSALRNIWNGEHIAIFTNGSIRFQYGLYNT